jgi:hypothetical protein
MVRSTVTEHLRSGETPVGLADGLARLRWGWEHGAAVVDRFARRPPEAGAGASARSSERVEPIAVGLGVIDGPPGSKWTVVRVVVPGAYRLEALGSVPHHHPTVPADAVGRPHPFG